MTRFDADAVADAVDPPPFSTVVARGERLRRRRVRAVVLAVAAVALAGAAAVPSAARWDSAPPAGQTTVPDTAFTETVLAGERTIVMVKRNACAAVFSVSTDAGVSWSAYRGPLQWRGCGIPVDTDYEILSPTVYAATVAGVTYLSRDGAATWQPGGDEVNVVDALPERAVLREGGALQGVDPVTGAVSQVRQTGTVAQVDDARFAPDGSLWAVGDSQVIVSKDRGRTWTAAATPGPLVVPVNARQAYVLGKKAVHRTDDGGQTWTPAAAGWASVTAATVGDAGRLMVLGGNPEGVRCIWTSTDNGRTFTAVPVTEPGFTTSGALPGTIWMATREGSVAVTHDGHTWQRTAARS